MLQDCILYTDTIHVALCKLSILKCAMRLMKSSENSSDETDLIMAALNEHEKGDHASDKPN